MENHLVRENHLEMGNHLEMENHLEIGNHLEMKNQLEIETKTFKIRFTDENVYSRKPKTNSIKIRCEECNEELTQKNYGRHIQSTLT